jgi:DNA-binding transcriptional LysR family regulator
LEDIKEAETLATTFHATIRGTIRLNISPTLTNSLTAMIIEFSEEHRDVSFCLIVSDKIGDLVEEGFDLAIRDDALPNSELISRRLGSASRIACASPDYLACCGSPIKPADLAQHRCLTYAPLLSDGKWRFSDAGGEYDVTVAGNLCSNDLQALLTAALSGHGVAALPETATTTSVARGDLVQVLPDYFLQQAAVRAVIPSRHRIPVKVRVFLDFAAEWFAQTRGRTVDPNRKEIVCNA